VLLQDDFGIEVAPRGDVQDLQHARLVVPLRELFEEEVRRIGLELGLPVTIEWK
jgi:GMP synthase PP-ATPase subunit